MASFTSFSVSLHFAPIGLLDMYNSGGAVVTLTSVEGLQGCIVRMKARGVGRFGAYSNQKPRYCTVETLKREFIYTPEDGLLTIMLEGDCKPKDIEFVY